MNQPSRKHKHSLETLALDIRQTFVKNIHLLEEWVVKLLGTKVTKSIF